MIASTREGPGALLVAGTVRGLTSESEPLLEALRAFGPRAVGVGVSREELDGLNEHFVGRPSEPLVVLSRVELSEAKALSRFGEVRVPNPSTIAVLEWARAAGVPVEPLDPTDEEYAELFTDHITYLELVRRTLRERRLVRDAPPEARSAEEFAGRWHASLSRGRGSRAFDAAREGALVEGARRLALAHARVAVVVDRERYDGVLKRLGSAAAP